MRQQYHGIVVGKKLNHRFEEHSESHTVNHQHNVVSHQESGNHHIGVGIEHIQDAVDEATLVGIDAGTHTIGAHKCNLHS